MEIAGEALVSGGDDVEVDGAISRAFLVALSQIGFPSIQQSDGDKLITMLLHRFSPDLDVARNASCSGGSFEEESIESLEKREVTFKLMAHVFDKAKLDSKLHDKASSIARRQLQSMSAFLKVVICVAIVLRSEQGWSCGKPNETFIYHLQNF